MVRSLTLEKVDFANIDDDICLTLRKINTVFRAKKKAAPPNGMYRVIFEISLHTQPHDTQSRQR
eukprot:scaffold35635_cov21-Prasinocladus_malaysianus.AAC.1